MTGRSARARGAKVDGPERALLIREPWVDLILDGRKTWELRGSRTSIRGRIALIKAGFGMIVGTCELVDAVGPLTKAELLRNKALHAVPTELIVGSRRYAETYAWVLRKPRRLATPIRYAHPPGAVIWARLSKAEVRTVASAEPHYARLRPPAPGERDQRR
jgi:hypothetical protein